MRIFSELMNLTQIIFEECDNIGLLVNSNDNPIKVGPDCYMFYATQLTDNCKNKGKCEQKRYYALTGGKSVKIVQSSYES